jgi:hypothetical protein
MFKKKVVLADQKARLDKLTLIIKLKVLEGPLLIHGLLQNITLNKAILALKLEQAVESLIPPQLGQKHLPLSFQYYDSILQ